VVDNIDTLTQDQLKEIQRILIEMHNRLCTVLHVDDQLEEVEFDLSLVDELII